MNATVSENALPGSPPAEWDIKSPADPFGHGNPAIEGFATELSVASGQRVEFKVRTAATAYRVDIYRLGYYQGLGARQLATVRPATALPQVQPAAMVDAATGMVDCGNWAVSAFWDVPADAVSGIHIATLRREDGGPGASHIPFIVRRNDGDADILVQTSDTTWQAYNDYGGASFYVGGPGGVGASALSYNRPFRTRGNEQGANYLFNAEYPLVRWLEANGYAVDYCAAADVDRSGESLLRHRVVVSVGHDEYWAAAQRANVEAARDAGVHLAFLSGNTMFWRVRWEPGSDPAHTPYRTLVCYKETRADRLLDPTGEWTGTWRDARFGTANGGGRPENGVTGTLTAKAEGFSATTIEVPTAFAAHRFWRNTAIASRGASTVQTPGTLGYEWDADLDNGHRPAGLAHLSHTREEAVSCLHGQGFVLAVGTADHNLTLYRHPSGALVFSAGTVQWAWALDAEHDSQGRVTGPADHSARQGMVNLLAEMGIGATGLQADLTAAQQSTDTTAPESAITHPSAGTVVAPCQQTTVAGTASEVEGIVAGVEVSVNGGVTWRPAVGTTSWTYDWTPTGNGPVRLLSRAVDDSANVESPTAGVEVVVGSASADPILLIVDSSYLENPFGDYYTEILRAEGLMSFQKVELRTVVTADDPAGFLAAFSVLILAEMRLAPAELDLLSEFVHRGGHLVAMRPDPALADLFGVTVGGERRQRPDAPLQYFAFETAAGPGRGLVSESLHHHGVADRYSLAGASPLGWLFDDIDTATEEAAVVLNRPGSGVAVAFAFDLARDIVLSRQGNPDWQNSEGDGVGITAPATNADFKPMDMFSRLDGRIWFEPARLLVPHADEKQRFLANVILDMLGTPVPRLWYLPAGQRAVIVNTGDGEDYGHATLDRPVSDVAAFGGRFTTYLTRGQIPGVDGPGLVSGDQAATWRQAGHEVSVHCWTDWAPGNPAGNVQTVAFMERAYADVASRLLAAYGHGPRTARSHTIDWVGWVDMARIESAHGTRLDLNYYHFWLMATAPKSRLPRDHSKASGYITGSAFPQRFCDETGRVLPIYQQLTQWPDEFYYNNQYEPQDVFEQCMRPMLAAAENEYPSVFVVNVHPGPYVAKLPSLAAYTPTEPYFRALWQHAQTHSLPLWSAEQLLNFAEARSASRFEAIGWDGTTLTFELVAPSSGTEFSVLLPGQGLHSVALDGVDVPVARAPWKGSSYGYVTITGHTAMVAASYSSAWTETSRSDFGGGKTDGTLVLGLAGGAIALSGAVGAPGLGVADGWDAWAASGDLAQTARWRAVGDRLVHETNATVPTYHPMVLASVEVPVADVGVRSRQRITQVADGIGCCGALGFVFGGVDAGSYWEMQYAQTGLGVRVYRRHTNGTFTLVGAAAHPDPVVGRWYDLRLHIVGGVASAHVDNTLVLTAPLADYTPGRMGVLGYQGSRSEIEDILVMGGLANPSGTYTSAVFDAGGRVDWGEAFWTAGVPAGTSFLVEVHGGDTPTPDGSWFDFQPVVASGASVAATAQFLQYRLTLTSSDGVTTPWCEEISFQYR